jgi:DNA-binding LytR/AlgR family response regulator
MFYIVMVVFMENKTKTSQSDENIEKQTENNEPDKNIQPAAKAEFMKRIAVKSGQKIHVITVSDVLYIQSEGDYVQIFTSDGKYLKEQTMKYFETNLPSQFVRVHRSYIVNIEAISRIELYEKQNQQLTLKNGHKIKISIAGYKLLKLRLNL